MTRQPPSSRRRRFGPALAAILAVLLVCVAIPASALWRPMPWSLATVWWDLPRTGPFRSLSMEMDVLTDLPSDQRVYLSAIGLGTLGATRFYGGVQTGARVPEGGRDRIALFSRWDERSPDAMRPAPGGFTESAGYEGDFISVRQRVPWHGGRYIVSLDVSESDSAHTWVRMTITETATGRSWDVGMLRFPGKDAVLGPRLASFVELYGEAIAPETIAHTTIRYGGLRINGEAVIPGKATVYYAPDIPPYAAARRQPGGWVAIDMGGRHDHSHLPRAKDGRFYESFAW
ncbi:MAG: hypothetical protein HQL34_09795 [Alphaproteobacteria bacterium]|nr:hypothetical protein [Alphaproteobacteria bacterium]